MQKASTLSHKLIRFPLKLLVGVATTALAVLMFLMAFDVAGRYFFNRPIPGSLEMVEYLMAVIVPLSIAYCALERSHVAVDLVADKLPRTVRSILRVIVTVLSIIFIGLMSWQNIAYIAETYRSNITSAVLKIPAYPFVAAVAVGMSLYTVILAVYLFNTRSKE